MRLSCDSEEFRDILDLLILLRNAHLSSGAFKTVGTRKFHATF